MANPQINPTAQMTYGERIGRAGEFIRSNLDQPIDLDRLAGIACFSPWHFHRIYRAVTGETVAETYRRHRLLRAAMELTRGEAPVAAIARRAGFSAAAPFIRAFSAAYGTTPGQFRRQRRPLGPTLVPQPETILMSNVEIVESLEITLAALPHRGDYNRIGSAFERLGALAGPRGLFGPEARMIGVYFDDPDVVAQNDLRSCAGISVAPEQPIDAPLERVVIKGGTYARAVHKGPYVDLHAFYQKLFRHWMPTSGREPGDGPCFEDYLNNPATLPPTEWLTAVFIPLKPE